MTRRVRRPGVQAGYDLWAESYDQSDNPLVALDRRYTPRHLGACRGERVLDAGCGTGANLVSLRRAGARPVGLDFSRGMLRVANFELKASGDRIRVIDDEGCVTDEVEYEQQWTGMSYGRTSDGDEAFGESDWQFFRRF